MTVHCVFPNCNEVIDANRDYQRIQGWHRKGHAGGSDIVGRKKIQPPEWACRWCVEKEKDGTLGQEPLI